MVMKESSKLFWMSLQQMKKSKLSFRDAKKRFFYTEQIFSKPVVERSEKNFLKSGNHYLKFRVSLNLSKRKLSMNKFREASVIK